MFVYHNAQNSAISFARISCNDQPTLTEALKTGTNITKVTDARIMSGCGATCASC